MRNLAKEPLIQFLLIGACIYGAYAWFGAPDEGVTDNTIIVDAARTDAFIGQWQQRWNQGVRVAVIYTVHLAMLQPLPDEVRAMLPAVAGDRVATSAFMGAFLGSVPLDAVFSPELINRFAVYVERGQQEVRNAA